MSAWQSANLREIGRVYREATCMPSDLVEAQQLATSKSEQAWRECRAANDWNTMKPLLAEVVNLSRREAEVRSSASDLGLYDALLDTYEPDVRSAQLDEVFADLKSFLPPFLDQVLGSQAQETLLPVTGDFSIEKQRALGMQIMGSLGFDFEHGRLDVSHHPFCGGVPEDVRITTRYDTESFVSAIMAVIHETGHAMYEQGLPKDWTSQPVGNALSAGTHESQSLLMEMQACRTKEFMNFMTPLAQRSFLGTETNDPAWSADNIYKLYTRVEKGFIRVDADEVTYPLHVILRYEIEKDLIEGKIEVSDLPALWHEKMTRYLGVATENNYTDGLLQ
ncbi:MAG: carboxypeptidase M32, partial [Pseudomonadales bacterium]